jgi:hypothetical protein
VIFKAFAEIFLDLWQFFLFFSLIVDFVTKKFLNFTTFCTKRNGGRVLSGVVCHFTLIFLGFINRLHVFF